MNWRLFTEDKKLQNRRGRQLRNDRQKSSRRRELALAALGDPYLVAHENAVSGVEVGDLLGGRDLRFAKRLIRRINAATVAGDAIAGLHSSGDGARSAVPRPSRLLRKANRGAVPQHVMTPPIPVSDWMGVDQALRRARELARQGFEPAGILRFLANPMATGLGLRACAELSHRHGVLGPPSAAMLEDLEHSAQFDAQMADAGALYRAMVSLGEIQAAAGNWHFFARDDLLALLPGLRLARVLRRDNFLVNVIVAQDARPICLDLHAITYKGLCRYPL